MDNVMPSKTRPLANLSNEDLCKLRDEIVAILNNRAEKLRTELNRLTGRTLINDEQNYGKRRKHKMKGRKIAPKYRGPDGTTWCGRGLQPRWLTHELKQGKKLEDFLIVPRDQASTKYAKKITPAARN